MATEAEIERMVFRLIGDGSKYQKMLVDAQTQTRKTAKELTSALNRVEKLEKKVNRAGEGILKSAKRMRQVGRTLTTRVSLPIAGMAGLAVNEFAKFDKAMIESTSIMGNLSDSTRAEMRELATTLSEGAIQAPDELAKSYFFLASAGLDAKESMAALPTVMKFATAGAFDMAQATDLLTDAQSALGKTIKGDPEKNMRNMTHLSDVLVKANTLANASVEQFATALTSKAGAAFKSYNIDLEEGVALLAAYADQGIKAELAGNAADRMIRLLTKAAADNADEFHRLGIRVFDVNGEFRSFQNVIGDIERATKGMSTQQKAATLQLLGFEARVQQVILPLLGTSEAIGRYANELRNASGITDEVANKQMNAFSNQMKVLTNQLKVAGIQLGEDLVPTIKELVVWVKDWLKWWKTLSPETRSLIVKIGLLVAALGPLLTVLGAVITVLMGPGGMIVAVTALAAAIATLIFKMSGASGALKKFNEEQRKSIALTNQFTKRANRETDQMVRNFEGMHGAAREAAIGDEIANTEKQLGAAIENMNRQLAKVREMDDNKWMIFRNFDKEAEQRRADDMLAVVDKFRNRLQRLRELAKRDVREAELAARQKGQVPIGFGNVTGGINAGLASTTKGLFAGITTGANAFSAAMRSVNQQVNKFQGLMDKGKRITEQFRTPLERFNDRQKELDELLRLGFINKGTFNRAMAEARQELEGARDGLERDLNVNMNLQVNGIDAALAGSAEAQARLLAFRAGQVGPNAAPRPQLAKQPVVQEQQRQLLANIDDKLAELIEQFAEGQINLENAGGA